MIELNLNIVFICILILFIYYCKSTYKLKKLPKTTIKVPDIVSCVKNIKKIKTRPIKQKVVLDKNDMAYYSELSQRINREEQIKYGIKPIGVSLNINDNILADIRNYADPIDIPPAIWANFTVDSQNVHNSLVQDGIKIKNAKNTPIGDNTSRIEITCMGEITEYAALNKNGHKIANILEKIKNRNSRISNINSTEIQVLNNAWNAANENIKSQIINELLDSDEGGHLVCPTGVVSRIINADIVENPELSPRTEKILREEMLTIAAKTRTDLESDPVYNKCSDVEQSTMLKTALTKKYIETYKDIVSMDLVQTELDSWCL
jgi:hypothetical protein